MRARTIAGVVVIAVLAAGAGAFALAWRPAIAPIAPPAPASFSSELVTQGRELALIGDCNVCHTAPGGAAFAGGRALPTPFGTIYASNITPDPQTGIGSWSQAAFVRAMRAGVSRSGQFIYPAHPYDHFTRIRSELALIGDCNVCHTAPGGAAFAGGRALPTPFGTIYASNITPDPQTGIGSWSQAAFVRAMRAGVSRSGQFIYPAHPYDHFTRI